MFTRQVCLTFTTCLGKKNPFLVRSSSWQGPFFLSNLSGQKGPHFSYVPVPGRGLLFLSNLSGQKGPHFSYVPVPGWGLFFSATYLGKKDPISRTFHFLAGAFFLSNLSAHKGPHFSY